LPCPLVQDLFSDKKEEKIEPRYDDESLPVEKGKGGRGIEIVPEKPHSISFSGSRDST
jgi:hypothetical protein